MSAHVLLHCDRLFAEGMCAESTHVQAVTTLAEARQVAARHGWHRQGGHDLCPRCCGAAYTVELFIGQGPKPVRS